MTQLLRTKLAPPRLRATLVPREALLARLDEGLERKLTLLSAPAGFGKTTLVRQWLAEKAKGKRQKAKEETEPDERVLPFAFSLLPFNAAWVALDEGDNDPVRFWRYVITACRAFQPDLGSAALGLLEAAQQARFEAVLTTFINDLSQLSERCVLVLEDYHSITAGQIHELMSFLLDHLPATLHIVLLTRSDPPLPLARLRARDELSELRAADLRFTPAETQTFLEQAMPIPLSPEAIARLEDRTEGWVAGLRLASLALQGRQEAHEVEHVLATFAGSHRHIAEYLSADVLGAQPEPLQEFLLQTSILNRLTGSLCDAVTGRDGSAVVLEQLAHANLFLFPLDGAGQWYRYHTLFAEAMRHEARRRLGETRLRELHDAASRWYERNGLLAEAVDAALAAWAFARAAALIERMIDHRGLTNELHTLRRWVEQLPGDVLSASPTICFAYAAAILFTEDRRAPATPSLLLPPLQLAEERWRAEDNRPKLGEALTLRAMMELWQGEHAQAFADTRQALALLPEDSHMWRGACLLNIGIEELYAGRVDAARQALLAAHAHCEAAGNGYGARAAIHLLGDMSARQGELRQAAELYQQEFAEAHEDLSDRGNALIGLAMLAYQWNDLALAEQRASEALAIGKQHADVIGRQLADESLVIPGSLILARVRHARGESVEARQLLQTLAAQTLERGWARLHSEVQAHQARAALAAGDLAAVQRWATTRAHQGEDVPFIYQERDALIAARLLIAQGDAGSALRALERWLAAAHEQGRASGEIEITILTALAHFASGNLTEARQAVTQALARARAEGFQRVFLDEGERMAALLRAILPDLEDERLAAYARTLLHAFAEGLEARDLRLADAVPASSLKPQASTLVEPLSPQEQRVLRLLAAGLSNPEIAEELVVSVNTIKTQVQSIYRKLDVTSRKEARAAARRLNLG